MNIKREFIFSCQHFGGFKDSIDINDCETLDDIITIMKDKLKNALVAINLEAQLSVFDNIKSTYHIHDYSIEHVLLNEGPYYICSICPNPPMNASDPIQDNIIETIMDCDSDIEEQLYNITLTE